MTKAVIFPSHRSFSSKRHCCDADIHINSFCCMPEGLFLLSGRLRYLSIKVIKDRVNAAIAFIVFNVRYKNSMS